MASLAITSTREAQADIDPLSGIDFVRIGAVGNAPWPGNGQPVDRAIGRGGVSYEYSIGRLEVTTAQWVEFLNAALDRPAGDSIPFISVPQFWGGASAPPMNPEGQRFRARPGQELYPVGDITWRMGAILANWYHNGKSLDRAAFLNGAYDVSTFGFVGNRFTDQLAHHPDARYWIPTWDEWLKSAHYDPNKVNGDGTTGGWWVYSNGTDTPLQGGPPGVGQANFGFSTGAFSVPLGAYAATTQSPWGLLDVAGATSEWTEEVFDFGFLVRPHDGSSWTLSQSFQAVDGVFAVAGSDFPHIADFSNGLRLASSVPAPTTGIPGAAVLFILGCLRRRR
ncbi:MAG: SUMF1/EgtB/PvdO family nonheme iron enzyme [Phycisphaerales bacterium]|nr:SUMF1/EgtB/PvdO family nonheme iron enzyme [Phycisphaerales bacterium]